MKRWMKRARVGLVWSVLMGACFDVMGQGIYHDGWIDFNKNGRMDIYEDASAETDARIEDLL
ncbi:MAG: hypothetical protein IJF77_06170, partial [Alistipes sp.]|nr:hypothetical protein [Alistipes sp.]